MRITEVHNHVKDGLTDYFNGLSIDEKELLWRLNDVATRWRYINAAREQGFIDYDKIKGANITFGAIDITADLLIKAFTID